MPKYSLIVPFHVATPARASANSSWLAGIVGFNPDAEIIIIDNGSCAEWRESLARLAPNNFTFISQEKSLSYAAACNAGARMATTDIFCFLNSDVEFSDPDWAAPFIDRLRWPSVGIAGVSGRRIMPQTWLGGELRYDNDVDYVEGWCVWMTRGMCDTLNGWDEIYHPFFCEDSDLCFRAVYTHKCRIEVIPPRLCKVRHLQSQTIKQEFSNERSILFQSTKKFRERWGKIFQPGAGFVGEQAVAILIPAHVQEAFLRECLDSLNEIAHRNVSVYVGLDRMKFEHREDYPFAQFIDLNFGEVNHTRNYLISHSVEPLIYFLDADNYLKPGAIEKMRAALIQQKADVVYCQAKILDQSMDHWFTGATPDGLLKTSPFNARRLREGNYIDMGSLVRRAALPSGDVFDVEMVALHDWDLWLEMAAAGKKFHYLEEPLFVYRIHNNNLSHDQNRWNVSIDLLRKKHGSDIGCPLHTPKISLVMIAKTRQEIDKKKADLSTQTIPPDEYCTSTLPRVRDAWAEAFGKVTGDVIVVTETDTLVTSDTFIEELIRAVRPGQIVKGLEVNFIYENFANIAFEAALIKAHPLPADMDLAEDTDWYWACRDAGITINRIMGATVIHHRGVATKKMLDRAYNYGRVHVQLMKKYHYHPLDDYIRETEMKLAIAQEELRGIRDELEAVNDVGRS